MRPLKIAKPAAIIAIVCRSLFAFGQGMSINTTGAAAKPSAVLDVSSTTKGMLAPRMLSTQRTAISSPDTGLLVYQTDAVAGLYYYNGSAWAPVSTTPKYLIPLGSAVTQLRLTTTATGTTDSVDLLGFGAAGNQLVNINGGSYLDPSNTFPMVAVPVPVSGTVTSFSFFFRVATPTFLMFIGTYTFLAQLYYSTPPSGNLIGAEQFFPVTGATVSINMNAVSGGILISPETLTGNVSGLSFSLSANSRLLVLVDYGVNTSPLSLQTLSGYATASVGMQ